MQKSIVSNSVAYYVASGGFFVAAAIWCVTAFMTSQTHAFSSAATMFAVSVMFLIFGGQARTNADW